MTTKKTLFEQTQPPPFLDPNLAPQKILNKRDRVYTVYKIFTVDMVYTVDIVYTVDTDLSLN